MNGDFAQLYRAVLEEAANDGPTIIQAVIRASHKSLHDRETNAKTIRDRHNLADARQYLNKHEAVMVERYASALRSAFGAIGKDIQPKAPDSVHFDQLELMDETQVVARVELARAEQVVVLAVSQYLAEFNALMCTAAGFSTVRTDRSSVRPELYVQALQSTLSLFPLPHTSREHLMSHMADALGHTLAALYPTWISRLRAQGVQPAGYAVRPSVDYGGAGFVPHAVVQASQPLSSQDQRLQQLGALRRAAPVQDESLLTLNKLRQLLAGELDHDGGDASPLSFAERFSRDFDKGSKDEGHDRTDFAATVPAAFEALKEMQQVEQVMARIHTRKAGAAPLVDAARAAPADVHANPRQSAKGLGQALSLEVVSLMVDNIAQDGRLLAPVQAAIKKLEPALLRLALVDPRFFSDKEHPARGLLEEITQRSLAFDSVGSTSFDQFFQPLQSILGPLSDLPIENALPFKVALQAVTEMWNEQQRKRDAQRDAAVQALQHIEARNLLASEVAAEIAERPDLRKTPVGVVDFLCGPWAQVIAHASLADQNKSSDPGHYRELVIALIWSAQPELTSQKIGKLTRLVPKLLSKLREGLSLIDYPSLKTSVFFELLMNLHQQAFRSNHRVAPVAPLAPVPALLPEHWVAPAEARASGFMEAPIEWVHAHPVPADQAADVPPAPENLAQNTTTVPAQVNTDVILPLGAWVELRVSEAWVRTQLSWASPHGTLFLFTSATGSTQSMTRRLRDKLIATGAMRVIANQAVVEGALDAVVQTAMNNSVDISI